MTPGPSHADGPGPPAAAAGYAAVMAAAALWAVSAVVARRLFDDGVSALEVTETRAVVAAAGFALVPAARRAPTGRPAPARFVALGVALALVNASYYSAVARIPVAVALVVQYTAPALVVAWAALAARRPPSRRVVVALLAALAGVALVADPAAAGAGRVDGAGLALAVAAAFCFAAYTLLAERTGAAYGSAGAMLRGFGVAAALWVVFQAPRGFPHDLVAAANLPRVLYVGVAGTLVPFFLFVWGVGRVGAERAAIAATLEPVVAAAVAWVWLGQDLSPWQLAGGALVVAAVAALRTAPTPLSSK